MKGDAGDPIYPVMKGKVTTIEHLSSGYGNYILIDHGNGLQTLYAHMLRIYAYRGQEVNTESIIGAVGSTGHSTGNHLHLEIIDQGRKINPMTLIGTGK